MSDPFGSSDSLSPITSASSQFPSITYSQAERPLTRTSSGTILGSGSTSSSPALVTSHLSLSSRAFSQSPLHHMTLPATMEEDERSSHVDSDSGSTPNRELIDPRDHSLLEFIYNEMHAARFINLEPLALLKNSFPLYFEGRYSAMFECTLIDPCASDSCIHPPVILTFPPLSNLTAPNSDKAVPLDEKPTVVSLLANSYPYILIDDDRFNPLYARARSTSSEDSITSIYEQFWHGDNDPSRTDKIHGRSRILHEGHTKRCRKPLGGIDFRLESLNMLLALRVQEVVGCMEEMWAWVLYYQSMEHTSPMRQKEARPYHETLTSMSRADFDDMVTRFQL